MASQSNSRKDDAGREWRGSSGERGSWRGSGRGFRQTARGRGGSWRSGGSVARGHGYVDSGSAHRSGRKSNGLCQEFQISGSCTRGSRCSFSHEPRERSDVDTTSRNPFEMSQEMAEEIEIRNEFRNNYNSWKRLIKSRPLSNDIRTIQILWQGALDLLDGHDRDSKQMVARDLEKDDFHGREHIRVVLEMTTNTNGAAIFLALVRPFLYVITHQALLDCLSIDTCVGNLYNFISGSNGSRAMPFFQRLMASLLETHKFADAISKENIERTMIAMSTCLRELVRRERRVLFHDDIPGIVTSLENSVGVVGVDRSSAAFSIIPSRTQELRGMIARANGLLYQEDQAQASGVSTTVMQSTYPRDIILPNGRHDNDKMDITDIRILPTEDEIRSEAVEFLPSTDPDQPHFLIDSAARLLDTHFRLLRHDIFGELKSALGDLILTIEAQPSVLADSRLNLTDIRAHSYMNAYVANITFDHRRGLEVRLSFSHPTQLAKKVQKERRKWWEESKRLSEGVLLCLLSFNGTKCSPLFLTITKKSTGLESDYSLVSHATEAFITAKLATQSQQDFESLMLLTSLATEGILIELPSVILATFTPILENLQYMQRLSRLPFRQWILPDRRGFGDAATMDVPPPLYARGMRFTYSLKSILNDGDGEDLRIGTVRVAVNDAALIDEIERRTELDRGQSEALLAALQREFCHIQGPPGTGKSFLGVRLVKVLLACRAARLGPIIIVCYTNHALDQFLEHLIQSGIEKVIRIGGQSKSDMLAGKNLRVVSQGENTTRSESGTLGATFAALRREEESIEEVIRQLDGLNDYPSWKSVKGYLALKHPQIYKQFSRFDEDGYETASQPVGGEPFDLWLKDNKGLSRLPLEHQEAYDIEGLLEFASLDVHGLYHDEKLLIAKFLAEAVRKDLIDELFECTKQTEEFSQALKNVYSDIDRRVLQTADIIGVTTTGLATKISTLRHVNAKVIVCEEAGEVLESHMLSALLPSVEHVVSIGDHEQLRPSINNHNLSLESHSGALYQLDRSQFERLSVGDPGRLSLPVAQLNIQRRMRPGISRFIKKIYPRLVDHDITRALPNVVGMQENIFWLHHGNFQDNANGDETNKKSHSNTWEVEMTAALVRHIVQQGVYSRSDIAVLTPYSGQLQKLRLHMRKEFEIVLSDRDEEVLANDGFIASDEELGSPILNSTGDRKPLQKKNLSELLRIATVDNFQGEEAKVVIVSLVRSNKEKNVGFLRTTNRINVLLSRAQHGLYLIGNSDTYSSVGMWKHVLDILEETNSIGESFGLCCPRHPETDIQVFKPDDFARWSPEGGCELVCNRRLPGCGHQCTAHCHSMGMHQAFQCPKPCERLHEPCGHSCQKATCGEDCGECRVKLDNIQLPCNHSEDGVSCHLTLDLRNIPCSFMVEKKVPDCGHVVTVACSRDVGSSTFICPTRCGVILLCGHSCGSTCGQCNRTEGDITTIEHLPCRKLCGRKFGTCSHNCKRACHSGKDCGLCSSRCEVQCAHSRCTLKCHEACAPCIEKCTWACTHQGGCNMPCAGPCDRLPCNMRCSLRLSCKHQCPGICGEPCPEGYCQTCTAKQDQRVDLLELKLYRDIDLDETPIIVLSCGHFFTAESLDGMFEMSEVYRQDLHGDFTGINESSSLASSVPQCPDCNCPLRQYATPRYNRVINRAVIDEMSKRFLVSGQAKLRELENKTRELEQEYEDSASDVIEAVGHGRRERKLTELLKKRNDKSRELERAIHNFCEKVKDKHQPATKLHDAIVTAIRQRSLDDELQTLSVTEPSRTSPRDRRIAFAGAGAMLRVQYITLADKFLIAQKLRSNHPSIKTPGGPPDALAGPFFQSCISYIDSCLDENLPKLAVEGILYYAKIARLYDSYICCSSSSQLGTKKRSSEAEKAKGLLERARGLCEKDFQNADLLLNAVEESIKFLGREWYEEVTKEELDAIKKAMVSGSGGIATHSGHWYECERGHPFAIGECGMPMELARCPECGASIGGQSHNLTEGVVRSERMER